MEGASERERERERERLSEGKREGGQEGEWEREGGREKERKERERERERDCVSGRQVWACVTTRVRRCKYDDRGLRVAAREGCIGGARRAGEMEWG